MCQYFFGVTTVKPTRKVAKQMNKICLEEGGYGFDEVNVKAGSAPNINHGNYQGWFCVHNMGNPFNQDIEKRILDKVASLK
jgi:hypothetical protein